MSNYRDQAINPKTGEVGDADFLDDYFGRHRYGIRFDGEVHVYPAHEIEVPGRPDLVRSDAPDQEGGA